MHQPHSSLSWGEMSSVLEEKRKASGYISGYIPPVFSLKGKDYLEKLGGNLVREANGK